MSNRTTDRRRRRLAQDEQLSAGEAASSPESVTQQPETGPVLIPAGAMIPAAYWKAGVIQLAAATFVLSLLWGGPAEGVPLRLTVLTGLAAIAAGQLALLVGWVRSTSDVDFGGQYRIWNWAAIGFFATGLVTLFQLQAPLASQIVEFTERLTGPLNAARPAVVFAPLFAASLWLSYRMLKDMRSCIVSRCFLVPGLLALVLAVFLRQAAHTAQIPETTLSGLNLLSACGICSAMYWHAHFVIHVNRHPPEANSRPISSAPVAVAEFSAPAETIEFANAEAKDEPETKPAPKKRKRRKAA